MSERTEWPTTRKLEQLREEGVISYSCFCTRCVVAASVFGVLVLDRSRATKIMNLVKRLYSDGVSFSKEDFYLLIREGINSSCVLLGVALSVSLLSGMLQTKFFFQASRVNFSLGNVWRISSISLTVFLGRMLKALFLSLMSLFISVSFLWYLLPGAYSLFGPERGLTSRKVQSLFFQGAWILIPTLLVGAVLVYLLNRFIFLWRHRMSLKEVETEQREIG